jgi:hypothetical protein
MKKKINNRSPTEMIPKIIWAKVRYYQMLDDMPDEVLAEYLNICTKTLRAYDKGAANLTLGQIARYIDLTDRKMTDLIADDAV